MCQNLRSQSSVTKHFASIASPYVSSYAFRDRNVDKNFGIRREADGTFKIDTSTVEIDPESNVYVQGKMYEGAPGLFELLTRKKVDHSLLSTNDLKNYRHILTFYVRTFKCLVLPCWPDVFGL